MITFTRISLWGLKVEDHAVTSQPTSAGSDTALALSATYRLTSYMLL